MSGLANNPRKFVALRMNTSPLRAAGVLTTYSVQGGEFGRFVVHERNPSEFYTQLLRGKHGLSSVSFANDFKSDFKPTARPDTEIEIARLVELHRNTKCAFDFECLTPSSSATKAREGGGGSESAPEVGCGAASSAKRGENGKTSGGRIGAEDTGEVDMAKLSPAGTPPGSAPGDRPTKRPPVFGLSTAPSGGW